MIEIKLTCETVAEAQAEMAALLDGRTRVSISGLGLKDMPLPAAVMPLAASPKPNWPSSEPVSGQPANVTSAAPSTTESSGESSGAEQPKRGRGRPRKDALAAPAAGSSSTSPDALQAATPPAGSEGNEPSGEASATETAEPTSDAASSTSSENATAPADAGNAAPVAAEASGSDAEASQPATGELPLVTDAELQRFCAKLAEKFGGPKEIFDASVPYLADGEVPRPTNIKANADRWQFIREMEAKSGLTYHG